MNKLNGWHITKTNKSIHVLPTNDERPHYLSNMCHCSPSKEQENNHLPVIIHNSFDGREMVEIGLNMIQ